MLFKNKSSMEKVLELQKEVISLPSPTATEQLPPYEALDHHELSTLPANWTSPVPELIPSPSRLLTVHAQGLSSCGYGAPCKEMSIPIYLGTDTTAAPLYTSTRAQRKSGNAILSHRNDGDIVSTTYRAGYGKSRQPKIRYLNSRQPFNSDVKGLPEATDEQGPVALTASTSTWTNTSTLTSEINPNQILTWKYVKTQTPLEGKLRVLALYAESVSASSSSKTNNSEQLLAVLVRSKSTRTPGSSRWDAGNGGQLLIHPNANSGIDEALIVSSCLMMLKKEIDRSRAAQSAALAS